MRTKMITLLLLFFIAKVFSQEGYLECATPTENNDPVPIEMHSFSIDPSLYQNSDPVVLNVKFWKVNGPNGEFYVDFSEDKLLEGIAKLNTSFNQYNIFFKYRGWDNFDSPADVIDRRRECIPDDPNNPSGSCTMDCITYPNPDPSGFSKLDFCQITDMFGYAFFNGYRDVSAINIYVTSWNIGFGDAALTMGTNQIVVKVASLNDIGMTHEMGHALGLYHTRSENEHVTRNPLDINNYNATSAGDYIADTAANPGFRQCDANGENCYPWILADCTYNQSSPEEDEVGVLYKEEMNPEDVLNTMGDALDCKVDDYFTPGQVNWMHETIQNHPAVNPTITTVASLYEPYKGEYYVVGPMPPNNPPLFQPGFKYLFVECENNPPTPTPVDYGTVFTYDLNTVLLSIDNNETHYSTITHPNHSAIQIKHEYGDFLETPQKCYDNWNRKPIGGSVTKFNDNVFNTNVTITAQDSTAINNQNLIQNLDSGLYKIDKIYNDGATKQTVIIKGNN